MPWMGIVPQANRRMVLTRWTGSLLLALLMGTSAAWIARADSQSFKDSVGPGQTRALTVTTDAAGPINYTLTWSSTAALRSAIYPPGSETPDATSSAPSPQPVSDLSSQIGTFTIRVAMPDGDPAGTTDFTLAVNYPTLTTTAAIANEVRDDTTRPPNQWIFQSADSPAPMFEVRGGNRAFVDYSLDGGRTFATIPATYVINRGSYDLVTALLPPQENNTAVAYRTRAVAPDGSESRRNRNAIYVVSDLPTAVADIENNPPFYKGEGMATPSPAAWRDQSVYMVMTDRFSNGDPTNDRLAFANFNLSDGRAIHGGDWVGLTSKLDYLQQLGITTIWITPVLQNWEAYHGYAAVNFLMPARQQGTLQELRDFVDAAHSRGMYVILDVTCNHQADLIYNTDGRYNFQYPQGHPTDFIYFTRNSGKPLPYPLEFRDLSVFHPYGALDRFDDQGANPSHAELGELSGLDDFRTESANVRALLIKITKWWIANTDVDGFRVDAVKHVELGFWQAFSSAIKTYAGSIGKDNFFLTGEFFDGNDQRLGRYTGTRGGGAFALDSLVYFPMYFTIQEVFKGNGATSRLDARYANNHYYYSPALLLTFLDNHDVSRFLYNGGANGTAKLRVALAFIHTSLGIPTLYYGTEQGFSGRREGDRNREDMFENPNWDGNRDHPGDNFNTDHPLFQYIKRLNEIRSQNIALRRGAQTQRWNNAQGAGLYIYTRREGDQEVMVVLNTSNSNQTANPRVTTSVIPPRTILQDQLSSRTMTAYDDGGGVTRVNVSVGPYGVQIFVP
ncbi:MAG: cyclomaltodextrinase C-terminal domain-containing protein [Acidobacteria bacterium]|nr:cyclomaltodextrinase C-terminal domain-containing protein [Acidobacteriota bacterium]MBI3657549.1 cyclomaltodextrinase C-terminal domain-containing protein [Acidobacteriota bacterium]